MAIDLNKFTKGKNFASADFNFDDAVDSIKVKTDAGSSVGQAIASAVSAGATPVASDTVQGKTSLAVAANYPSTSDAEAVTPAYLTAALSAMTDVFGG